MELKPHMRDDIVAALTVAVMVILLLIAAGCEKPLEIPPAGSYLPELCAVVGVIGGESAPPQPPAPAPPAPKPDSDVCPNCNGTGKLGDGRVEIVCPVCDGSGKVTQADAARKLIHLVATTNEVRDEVKTLRANAVSGNAKLAELRSEVAQLKESALRIATVPILRRHGDDFWGHSLKAGREQATQDSKPMLVHWYADWCGPCRNMKRMVLLNEKVQDSLDGLVVPLAIDADEDKQRTKTWGVNELPKDMVVSPDYKKRIDLPITIDPDKYIQRVTDAAKEVQAYIDTNKEGTTDRPVVHEVVREVILERPVYFPQQALPTVEYFPPGYRGGQACAGGSCGMGIW